MAPLILHNVPDDELYVGDDGVQRPYAMVFPHQDDHASSKRSRRAAAETGSFGKSSRRSRSKTATPRPREDPTIAAADKVFSNWFQDQAKANNEEETTPPNQRRKAQLQDEDESAPAKRFASTTTKEPTEIILRGYKNALQQYAAIDRYEQVAGRICEDYPRDPPVENRRYKSELRDPAYTRRRALTPEERAKVNKADGGEHWVKVTFESADAADLAMSASPLSIHGFLVYAEPYHGIPPTRDEPVLDGPGDRESTFGSPTKSQRHSYNRIASFGNRRRFSGFEDGSPTSSRTADTGTLTTDSATLSSGTLRGDNSNYNNHNDLFSPIQQQETTGDEFSRVIPTARKVKLLPAEQALLPQRSTWQWLLSIIPILNWFSGSMIGDQVPRTETGEFDWNRASLYWKLICWCDMWFGLFGGEILHADKDE
ncbi:hypothetical protein DL546_000048 [Coniochaeta pulveracea]|uniref:Nup53p-like protein n=1 Tax=Coniochaeta pulveracea TaxID=177199 RepID=A0A420Y6U7_9PEZI|nr:hypothetical protein DL546_000048 [Coniochaeta pulveracea]